MFFAVILVLVLTAWATLEWLRWNKTFGTLESKPTTPQLVQSETVNINKIEDITSTKIANDPVDDSMECLTKMVDCLDEILFLVNENLDIVHANGAARATWVAKKYTVNLSSFLELEEEDGIKAFEQLCAVLSEQNIVDSAPPIRIKFIRSDVGENFFADIFVSRFSTRLELPFSHILRVSKISQTTPDEKAKDNFLAMMSHEIRTPLGVIIVLAGLLSEEKLKSSQMNLVQTMRKSADMLLGIVNDILYYSKLEDASVTLHLTRFNLVRCVERVCDVLALAAEKKEQELICFISQDTPTSVVGDPQRLTQILLNLINNAIKFTPRGGEIALNVKCNNRRLDQASNAFHFQILFEVCDTGIGIFEHQLKQLFKPFSQIDNSTTRANGGTGLGLVICQKLAKLMSGKITVKSIPRKGSTFIAELGFKGTIINSPVSIVDDAQPHLPVMICVRSKRLRTMLRSHLQSAGFRVKTCSVQKFSGLLKSQGTARTLHAVIFDTTFLKDAASKGVPRRHSETTGTTTSGTEDQYEGMLRYLAASPAQVNRRASINTTEMRFVDSPEHENRRSSTANVTGVSIRGSQSATYLPGTSPSPDTPQRAFSRAFCSGNINLLAMQYLWDSSPLEPFSDPKDNNKEGEGTTMKPTNEEKYPLLVMLCHVQERQQAKWFVNTRKISSFLVKPLHRGRLLSCVRPRKSLRRLSDPGSGGTCAPTTAAEPRRTSIAVVSSEHSKIKRAKGFEEDLQRRPLAILANVDHLVNPVLVPLEEEEEEQQQKLGLPESRRRYYGGTEFVVLLAEDNKLNQMMMDKIFQKDQISYAWCKNGQEALTEMKLAGDSYKVILMDVMMPTMDGFTATRKIRKWEKKHNRTAIPIIALTANVIPGDREKCMLVGMDDYLSKPLQRSLLNEKLQAIQKDGPSVYK